MRRVHIISASRRTDLPAFFTPWLMGRVRAGEVMVRNPRNPQHVMRISLAPADVVAVVFWSRDYGKLLAHLDELDDRGLRGCFQFTFTGYGELMEPRVPSLTRAAEQFEALAARYGRQRVVWRYDPVVFGSEHDEAWHLRQFRYLASVLGPCVTDVVLSFLDRYPSARRGLESLGAATGESFGAPSFAQRCALASELAAIGAERGLRVRACCEPDVVGAGAIAAARCIDPELIRAVAGDTAQLKDAPTRKGCGCVWARDIGAYHCCAHGCVYCYANASPEAGLRGATQAEPAANHLGAGELCEQRPERKKRMLQPALPWGGEPGPGRE
jgi:hypothetical protein